MFHQGNLNQRFLIIFDEQNLGIGDFVFYLESIKFLDIGFPGDCGIYHFM